MVVSGGPNSQHPEGVFAVRPRGARRVAAGSLAVRRMIVCSFQVQCVCSLQSCRAIPSGFAVDRNEKQCVPRFSPFCMCGHGGFSRGSSGTCPIPIFPFFRYGFTEWRSTRLQKRVHFFCNPRTPIQCWRGPARLALRVRGPTLNGGSGGSDDDADLFFGHTRTDATNLVHF